MHIRRSPLIALITSLGFLTLPAGAADEADSARSEMAQAYANAKGEVSDAYITGRLMTAYTLSEHLNPFDIGIDVEDAMVTLNGTVANGVQRDLAVEIARGVPQVRDVTSRLQVNEAVEEKASAANGSFGQRFNDATTTARVKSRLIVNQSTEGLAIDVDTEKSVVTLNGKVASHAEAALAEQIAQNTDGVAKVRNQLKVRKAS